MLLPHTRSFGTKILLLATLASGLAVIVLGLTFRTIELIELRPRALQSVSAHAEIISAYSTAPLSFRDVDAGKEFLATLERLPQVSAARLYDSEGEVFATFERPVHAVLLPTQPPHAGHRFIEGHLVLTMPVVHRGEPLGSLLVAYDMSEFYWRITRNLLIMLVAAAASVALASVFAMRLRESLLKPMLGLAATARDVGTTRDYTLRSAALTDDEIGDLSRAFNGMLEQIQRNDEAVRRAQAGLAQLASIVLSSNDAIVGVSLHGTIESWNKGAVDIYGLEEAEVIGKPVQVLAGVGHTGRLLRSIENVRRGNALESLLMVRESDGPRAKSIEMVISPIRGQREELSGFSLIARDVTLLKEAERALQAANEELKQKNTEMEQFVYSVSHDLKSPLVTIKGFVGLMKLDIGQGRAERLPRFAMRIDDAAGHMVNSIDDLLTLSRIGRVPLEPELLDVEEVLNRIIEGHAKEIEDGKIEVTVEPGLPHIFFDRKQLIHVFDNLIANAMKYGGDVPGPTIRIGHRVTDNALELFVRDNGPGIAPEHHEFIFGLFQRLNTSKEGTGVGLATVKRILENIQGRVWVESELGRGATFWVALPLSVVRSAPSAVEPVPIEEDPP